MKTVTLIRSPYDGGKSDRMAAALNARGITFATLHYGEELVPFPVSDVPCVAVLDDDDVTLIEQREEGSFDGNRVQSALNAPPRARLTADFIVSKKVVAVDEAFTLRVEIRDQTGALQSFTGNRIIDLKGPRGLIPLGLSFTAGVADRTVVFHEPGYYHLDPERLRPWRVSPLKIQVYL